MRIETKFNLNDRVWLICQEQLKEWIPCSGCKATGTITLNDGESNTCPKCYGRLGQTKWGVQAWQVSKRLTIGQIQYKVENIVPDGIFDNIGHYDVNAPPKTEERYMCYETGVGTGSLWEAANLFSAEDDARQECALRNEAEITEL